MAFFIPKTQKTQTMSKVKFNGQDCEVRQCGSRHAKNFNGQNEGGGTHVKLGLFNESGEKIGAIVPHKIGHAKVLDNGKAIGSVTYNPE